MSDKAPPLIADANVLIDYVNTDASILALLARHEGPVFVATVVLENVDQLDVAECERLGLTVVQPTVEELIEAGAKRGGLAFDDHVCLILAREHDWCCVTNDKALRKACSVEVWSALLADVQNADVIGERVETGALWKIMKNWDLDTGADMELPDPRVSFWPVG